MIRDLELTLEWLANLEEVIGLERLLDCMPNNWRGRETLREWLEVLEGDRPWTFDAATGQIRNAEGWALASVPRTLGDAQDLANGQLMAQAPALLAKVGRLRAELERLRKTPKPGEV